ncbi:hypothetical protein HOLleu_00988 [Holothuria leucospilota]|uniref:Uncharacterized protein n=1 Tax=Holothuria leucospilota TaxID=206669 RepID=A0A9Q1CNQ6_HOLLE|nr:hypothetical protein HOLleu_00988 [Holothuria leucospilota]
MPGNGTDIGTTIEWSGLYGYRLNMNSGQWEHDDGRKEMAVMTDENYREEEQWIVNLQSRSLPQLYYLLFLFCHFEYFT